ncbi:MAG TPA: hypothetical protein VFF04_02055, partial [Candidatus Babeliales bacterium]|nr:hypothetical protein [Candidatus Babeliales bacterium]
MGQERSGIALLLGLLLLFSSFLGVLYAKKASYESPIIPYKSKQAKLKVEPQLQLESTLSGLGTVSTGEIELAIIPFIMAQDNEKIIEIMKDLPAMTAHDVLADIRANPQLSRDDFLKILFGVALNYVGNTDAQNTIFSLLLSYPALRRGAPFLFVAADSKQAKIIPMLLTWADQQKQHYPWLTTAEAEVLQYAVQKNASRVLETAYSLGIKINTQLATQLLWQAVIERRDLNTIR